MGKIKEALSFVKGGFAYILLFEDKLIAALDPNGFRPLSIGKMANGAVVVSSETCAFEVIGAEWIRDVKPGEIVIVDDSGIQYDSYTNDTQLAICSMEYIYFARPDSNIHGVNVHTALFRSTAYASVRMLYAMGKSGMAYKSFRKVNRFGVPVRSVLATAVVVLLLFLIEIFNDHAYEYILAASSLTSFIS